MFNVNYERKSATNLTCQAGYAFKLSLGYCAAFPDTPAAVLLLISEFFTPVGYSAEQIRPVLIFCAKHFVILNYQLWEYLIKQELC